MEYSKLSGYDQYILLTLQTRNIGANVQAYNQFVEVLEFLESCTKSDNAVVNVHTQILTDAPRPRNILANLIFRLYSW